MEDEIATLRHNILGQLTVVKNALAFVLGGQTGQISKKSKEFLEEAYKRNEQVINMLIETRKEKVDRG